VNGTDRPGGGVNGAGRLLVELGADRGSGIRIEWDPERLRSLRQSGRETAERPWTLEAAEGERAQPVRVLSAAFEDGSLLAVAATRSPGAAGHDEEEVRAVLAHRDEQPVEIADTLLSTQYGPDGAVTRVGLELYDDPEGPPRRVAGDRLTGRGAGEARSADSVVMSFRIDGTDGIGHYDSIESDHSRSQPK